MILDWQKISHLEALENRKEFGLSPKIWGGWGESRVKGYLDQGWVRLSGIIGNHNLYITEAGSNELAKAGRLRERL